MSDSARKSFLSPGKVILLFMLGFVVFVTTMVLWVPAGWLWKQASTRIELPPEVTVSQVSGQLWEGAAGLLLAGFPCRLEWELDPLSLGRLELPIQVSLTTSSSRIDSQVLVRWPASAVLQAKGLIKVNEFEKLIRESRGAMISGEVKIESLYMELADNGIQQADGFARWPGGLVTWPMGTQTGEASFPPMQATLDTLGSGLELTISEQGGSGPAAKVGLLREGVMDIRLYKRMVDLAQQPWSGADGPGDVIFRVQQPLISGGL